MYVKYIYQYLAYILKSINCVTRYLIQAFKKMSYYNILETSQCYREQFAIIFIIKCKDVEYIPLVP